MTGQAFRTLKEYLPFVYLFIVDGINGDLREEERLWNSIEREVSEIVVDRARTLADFLFSDKENIVLVSDRTEASPKTVA